MKIKELTALAVAALIALAARNDAARAIPDFDKAIELRPDDPFARFGRGRCYATPGFYCEAGDDFDEAERLDPDILDKASPAWRMKRRVAAWALR